MKIRFMGNRRGLIDVAVVALVAVCGVIMWLCGPTVIKATSSMIHGGNNQKKATHSVTSERTLYQVDPQHPDKLIPVKEKYKEESYALDANEPEDSLWTKFWHLGVGAVLIIIVLSYLGIWPVVVLYWNKVVKPKIDKAKADLEAMTVTHDELSGDATLIVQSVDDGLAELNKHIDLTKAGVDSAQADLATAGTIADPAQRQATIIMAQQKLSVAQAVLSSVTNMKQDFKDALSMKQDSTTKMLVAKLRND